MSKSLKNSLNKSGIAARRFSIERGHILCNPFCEFILAKVTDESDLACFVTFLCRATAKLDQPIYRLQEVQLALPLPRGNVQQHSTDEQYSSTEQYRRTV